MQFFNSSISLNPIPNSIRNHSSSTTGHALDSMLPPWEYRHFLAIAYDDPWYDQQQITYSQAVDLLSFDKLFSNPMVQNMHLVYTEDKFTELFYWKNQTLVKEWIRYFML
jgi:hypothetical protein